MLVIMAYQETADDWDDTISFTENEVIGDFLNVATLGKETVLLFLFASLARLVNDEADDVVTDVFMWPLEPSLDEPTLLEPVNDEEAGGSELELEMKQMKKQFKKLEKENRRLDMHLDMHQQRLDMRQRRLEIITEGSDLNILTSRNPVHRSGMVRRIMSSKAGGIRFKVLGIRWTSKEVQALVGSFVISVISIVWNKYAGLE